MPAITYTKMTLRISMRMSRWLAIWLTIFTIVLTTINPVFAEQSAVKCPSGMSKLDCNALLNDAANWVPLGSGMVGCFTGNSSLAGNNNAEMIWNYFIGKGLKPVAVAGIMGNFQQESGFDPAVKQNYTKKALPDDGDGKTGYGIAQWTSQGRQAGLFAQMRAANLQQYYGSGWGHPEKNKEMPIEDRSKLLLVELNYAWDSDSTKISDLADQLNATTTETGDDGSTVLFHKLFERSADNASQIQERVDSATSILEDFKGVTGEGSTGISGCSESLGGVSTIEDAIPWAMRFIQDTKTEYNSAPPAIATIFGNPSGNDRIVSLAKWPDNSGFNCWGASGCDECVTASGWFVTNMTDYTFYNGNGGEVVNKLESRGTPTGSEPRPFSIFSYNTGSYGHTGIVLGVLQGGTVITLENNWPRDTLSVRKYNLKADHPDVKFAYVGDKLKVDVGSIETGTQTGE